MMTDDLLLTAAKLREAGRDELDADPALLDHAGLPEDASHIKALTFLEGAGVGWDDSRLAELVRAELRTRSASAAVRDSHAEALSYVVGVTEQDLEASALTVTARLIDRLEAEQLTTITGAGNPNTGKTNSMLLLAELHRLRADDPMLISNVSSFSRSDRTVTSMHELMTVVTEHRERDKFIIVDEGSTHFDARTNRREVASQWTPAVKRFSKLGVDAVGCIGHTGKDIHPEVKRLTNLAFWKSAPDSITFYGRWPEESSTPTDELFGGSLEHLEPVPPEMYDPDDMSPWSWNLEPDLFGSEFDSMDEFADLLARARA